MKKKNLMVLATFSVALALTAGVVSMASTHYFESQASLRQLQDPTSFSINLSGEYGTEGYYGDGNFTIQTNERGNDVGFEFKYGKKHSGSVIELGKNSVGNPGFSNYYIGNVDPITGSTSINVNFEGSAYLLLYAAVQNTDEYKLVDVFTSSKTTTNLGKGYFYYRFVNGSQETDACVINSISFSYLCDDYSDESVDLTNVAVQAGSTGEACEIDTNEKYEMFNSRQSLHLTIDVSKEQANFVLPLGRTFTAEEANHLVVEFYVNGENNADCPKSSGTKTYFRFVVYPSNNWNKNSNASIQTDDIKNGTQGWTKVVCDFSKMKTAYTNTMNAVYLRGIYLNNVHIDHMRVYFNDNYPAISDELIEKYEANDLTNTTVTIPYDKGSKIFSDISYQYHYTNSVRSSMIRVTADYKMWSYEGMEEDMQGKVLDFYFHALEYAEGKNYVSLSIQFSYDGQIYTASSLYSRTINDGVRRVIEDGWEHYTLDFDIMISSGLAKTTTSTNIGFNMGHGRLVFVDNLTLKTTVTTTFVVNYDTGGYGDIYMFGDFGTTPTWSEDTAIHMTWNDGNNWKVTIEAPRGTTYTFKFVKVFFDSKTYENGDNRTFTFTGVTSGEYIFYWQA